MIAKLLKPTCEQMREPFSLVISHIMFAPSYAPWTYVKTLYYFPNVQAKDLGYEVMKSLPPHPYVSFLHSRVEKFSSSSSQIIIDWLYLYKWVIQISSSLISFFYLPFQVWSHTMTSYFSFFEAKMKYSIVNFALEKS